MDRQKTKEEVIDALHGVASEMHDKMMKGNPPTMTLPVRSKSNIGFDKKLGVYTVSYTHLTLPTILLV